MTTPREIIAYTIPGTSAELCFGLADAIVERLTATGHHILSDADLAARDGAVLERAAIMARECFYDPQAETDPDYLPAAIRSLKGGQS